MEQAPALTFAFRVSAHVAAPLDIGETGWWERRVVPILGGTLEGPGLKGRILPGGADYQMIRADGLSDLRAHYCIELDDGALIYVQNSGLRYGSAEALGRLRRGEPVDPAEIYFRSVPRFETAAPHLAWLMTHVFVGTGVRTPAAVDLSIFKVG